MTKNKLFFGMFVAVLAVAPFSVFAGTFQAGESYQLNPGSLVEDNLYVAGSNVGIAGTVKGDLFATGGTIIVSGPVSGDMMSAGGTLNIMGNVSGDTRVAGGTIILSNSVGGELLAAGGTINIGFGSVVSGDAGIAGGTVNYDGIVGKDLTMSGKKVYLNGIVHGNVSIHAEEIALGPKALIDGNLEYYAPKEATVEQGAKIGGTVNFHKTELPIEKSENKGIVGFIGIAWIIKSLMMIVTALIALYFLKSQTMLVLKEADSNFWKEVGRGFITLIIIPIAVIISLITIVGIPLGIIAILFYGIFLIIASVLAPLLFAWLTIRHIFKRENYEPNWWIAILAVVVFGLVSLIPIIGWIFCFMIFLASCGAVTNHIYKKLK